MKTMFRMGVVSLMLLVGVAGLTGCKKKPPAEPPAPAPPPVAKPAPPPKPVPPPKPEPKPVAPTRPSLATLNSQLRTVYFDFDKSSLRRDQVSSLDANASLMKQYPEFNILIEGHCDERGTVEYNLALGDRRANTINLALQERGVAAGRISTISYGEERPVDPGHRESAWSKNRRAEFRLLQR